MAAHESGIRLLERGSSDSAFSADSFSADDHLHGATPAARRHPRMARSRLLGWLALALHSLSHRPLGWRARRKGGAARVSGPARLLVCAYNAVVVLLALFVARAVFDAAFFPSYWTLPAHYREFEKRLHEGPTARGRGNPGGQKIFIASNIIQHDKIRGAWGQSLLKLVDYLGPENVFVSIYENDSGPEAPKALAWLRSQLPCEPSSIRT
jgi:hypothetical protein